jgi:hypothetical protein
MKLKTYIYVYCGVLLFAGLFLFSSNANAQSTSYTGKLEPISQGDKPQVINQIPLTGGDSKRRNTDFSAEQISLALFEADSLTAAYTTINNMRSFYTEHNNSSQLWKNTLSLLFVDRAKLGSVECIAVENSFAPGTEQQPKINYNRKLVDVLGDAFYTELNFCLGYLGMSYTDRELWDAYVWNRTSLVADVLAYKDASQRLKAFILAADVYYTVCMRKEEPALGSCFQCAAISQN